MGLAKFVPFRVSYLKKKTKIKLPLHIRNLPEQKARIDSNTNKDLYLSFSGPRFSYEMFSRQF